MKDYHLSAHEKMTDVERNALFQQTDKGLLKARVT